MDRWVPWAVWIVAGCAGVVTPPLDVGVGSAISGAPPGFTCPDGTRWQGEAPGASSLGIEAGTRVHTCREGDVPRGPHLELFEDGRVAVEGVWAGGERDGAWLRWYPDGAFRSRVRRPPSVAAFGPGSEYIIGSFGISGSCPNRSG